MAAAEEIRDEAPSRDEAIEVPETLAAWLRGVERCGCVRIEARHHVAGSDGGSAVATFELSEDDDAGDRFDAAALYARLIADAEGIGGMQRYVLFAFRDGTRGARDRFQLRVDGGSDGDTSASEGANAVGLVAQAHRHNEALMHALSRTTSAAFNMLEKTNAKLLDRLDRYESERTDVFDLLGQVHKSDREAKREDAELAAKQERSKVLADGVRLLMPALLSKVAPSTAVKESAILRVIESLTDAQRAHVFSLLSIEQQAALGAALDGVLAAESKKEGGP